jgi:putative hydrolase of the HAD superfamily
VNRLSARVGKSPAEVEQYFRRTPHAVELALGKMTKRSFYGTVARDLGFDGPYDEFADIWAAIFTPIAPMIALAESLRDRLPRLLLSNTNIIHMEYIYRHFPFVAEFDQQVLSYEVGLLKPDASIYRHTIEKSGLTAARMLFIDDLPANVEGARTVGLQAILHVDFDQTRAELTKLGVLPI